MSGSEPWVRRVGHLAALAVAQSILLAACADSRDVAWPTGEIRASGSATVSAEADVAVLSLGVVAVRPTVGDARNAAARSLSALVTALGAAGVDESDIRTASFQIQPRYRYSDDDEEEFVGHEVWHFLRVTVRDVAAAGDIIDRAVAAGGASIRVQNVDFRVEDTPMLEREARSLAIQNATEKADFYASQLGVNRGPVLSLSDHVGVAGLERGVSSFAVAESRGTQFYAGPVRVNAHVEMVFAIE